MSHIQYSIPEKDSKAWENYTANEQLLYISDTTYGKDWHSALHTHSFAEIIFVVGGEGNFCIYDKQISISKNSLVLINPGVKHTETSSEKNPLKYIVLGVSNLSFAVSENNDNDELVYSLPKAREELLILLNMMLTEAKEKKTSSNVICQSLLTVILLKIHRYTENNFISYNTKDITSECLYIQNYMDSHYSEDITLDMLSDMVHLNKYYLSHTFTKAYGISPIGYLLEKRIIRSQELLKLSDYSITRIAQSTGFSSPNYFSKYFKKYTGLTAKNFRKLYR